MGINFKQIVNGYSKSGNTVHSVVRNPGRMLLQSNITPPPLSGGQIVQLLHSSLLLPIFGMHDLSLIFIGILFFFKDDDDLDESSKSFAVDAVLPNISSNMFASGTDPGKPVNNPKHTGLKTSGNVTLNTLASWKQISAVTGDPANAILHTFTTNRNPGEPQSNLSFGSFVKRRRMIHDSCFRRQSTTNAGGNPTGSQLHSFRTKIFSIVLSISCSQRRSIIPPNSCN